MALRHYIIKFINYYFKIPNQSSKGSINTKKRIARDATAPGRKILYNYGDSLSKNFLLNITCQ